jgi:DNA-binding NtrC family response regulator
MSNKKVLVVDDDESIRKTFFLILRENYQVQLAKDAEDALARFRKSEFDLIITDLKLPAKSGLEMISEFRESGYGGESILISSYPDLIDVEELSRLSIRHCYVKPLDLKQLIQSIDYLFGEQKNSENRI